MPGCVLPKYLDSYREDAVAQLKKGVEFHRKLFGANPVGMWPSEGSVSQEVIAAIADQGIEWIATDEEILAASTNGWVSRDGGGSLRNPEMLYRPWRLEEQGRSLQIVFRDHALSDLIGFQYQRSDPQHAANDLLGKIDAIGLATVPHNAGRPALVPVILDGENCWEYFADGGVQFLRTLYRSCVSRPSVQPVRVQDHIREFPATDRISQLFAGSWINHNFDIWIGHSEDHTAWDLLHQTREFLKQTEFNQSQPHPMQPASPIAPEVLARAWDEIYIAEGSDWFWWFGDDHSSAQDGLFDQLFRKHLKNVYLLLKTPYPVQLDRPIGSAGQKPIQSEPKGFLKVKIDGRQTYFEWINAGHYVSGSERGTMTMVTRGIIREVFFGFDAERFLLRIDTAGRALDDLKSVHEIRIGFASPNEVEIRISGFATGLLIAAIYLTDQTVALSQAEVAVHSVVEVAASLTMMNFVRGARVEFYVSALIDNQCEDRVPREGLLTMNEPTTDFELQMWQA